MEIKQKKGQFYREIGKYFSPVGKLKEDFFREYIRKTLAEIKDKSSGMEDFQKSAEDWISSYLSDIVVYLDEKGMPDASKNLFKAVFEESYEQGLSHLKIPLDSVKFAINTFSHRNEKNHRKNRTEKRKKIFEAAIQLFVEKGFHKTSVEEIAKRAGIAKGSIYVNFKSKQDILDQLLEEKNKEIVDTFSEYFDRDDDVLIQVQEALISWVYFIEKNYLLYQLIQSKDIFSEHQNRSMFYKMIMSMVPMIKERIIALNHDSKLKNISFSSAFYGVLGFIDGVAQKWLDNDMQYPLSDEIPLILEVLFNGFATENIEVMHSSQS